MLSQRDLGQLLIRFKPPNDDRVSQTPVNNFYKRLIPRSDRKNHPVKRLAKSTALHTTTVSLESSSVHAFLNAASSPTSATLAVAEARELTIDEVLVAYVIGVEV